MRLINADAVRRIVHSVHGDYSGYDFYDGVWWLLNRIKELPTIELPPHGDLISLKDAETVIDRFLGYLDEEMIYRIKYKLNQDCSIIVPANKEDSE